MMCLLQKSSTMRAVDDSLGRSAAWAAFIQRAGAIRVHSVALTASAPLFSPLIQKHKKRLILYYNMYFSILYVKRAKSITSTLITINYYSYSSI
ncbi:hypothetical protein GQ607_014205 [Colletotrichum asianum]|uniref:Uncharacterized protein n=1 Tax=Colletotrichum asianum TaxID=702518 RepID=A0A8H3W5D4_9PEZI|nr:hypothetical protein GQ607_014205 [Colletotrichum asianum]